MYESEIDRPTDEITTSITTDLYLAAYLQHNGIKIEFQMVGDRVAFTYDPEADNLAKDFIRSDIGMFVERFKSLKTEMYNFKTKNVKNQKH